VILTFVRVTGSKEVRGLGRLVCDGDTECWSFKDGAWFPEILWSGEVLATEFVVVSDKEAVAWLKEVKAADVDIPNLSSTEKDSQSNEEIRKRGEAKADKIQAAQFKAIDAAIARDEAFDKKHGVKSKEIYDLVQEISKKPEPEKSKEKVTMPFKILVYENWNYMNEEYYTGGEYESYEIAVGVCKRIVDVCLKEKYKEGMSADDLYQHYVDDGEDPAIFPRPKENAFSGWDYAKECCSEICKENAGGKSNERSR